MHLAFAIYFYISVGFHLINGLYNLRLDIAIPLAKTGADRAAAQQRAIDYYGTRSEKSHYKPMIFCIGLVAGVIANAVSESKSSPVSSILAVVLIPTGIAINTKYVTVPANKIKQSILSKSEEVDTNALLDAMRIGHMASLVYIPLMLACVAIKF